MIHLVLHLYLADSTQMSSHTFLFISLYFKALREGRKEGQARIEGQESKISFSMLKHLNILFLEHFIMY